MTQQFNGLQVLRYVAAMLVAVMHITQAISIYITGRGENVYWAPGGSGVDIFFVISGFVMAITTRAQHDDRRARREAAWVFARRRLLRIVPLYWFYTLLKVALVLALPALAVKSVIEPSHLAASLLFMPVTSPWGLVQPVLPVGWTLNFEMLFYTVFAVAIALGAPRIRFCLVFFLALFVAAQLMPSVVPLAFYGQSIIFEFVLGVAIAHALIRFARPHAAIAILVALAGALLMFGFGWRIDGERLFPWGVGAAAIVLGTAWLEPWIARAPAVKPLAFLGDASYSIYLSHPFVVPAVVMALHRIGVNDSLSVLLAAGATVTLAGCLSHVFLEKPMMSFFRRYLFRPTRPTYQNAANSPAK
jgi:exopolysaccharide production protein ExoZ